MLFGWISVALYKGGGVIFIRSELLSMTEYDVISWIGSAKFFGNTL